jgi:hypothetical protein
MLNTMIAAVESEIQTEQCEVVENDLIETADKKGLLRPTFAV